MFRGLKRWLDSPSRLLGKGKALRRSSGGHQGEVPIEGDPAERTQMLQDQNQREHFDRRRRSQGRCVEGGDHPWDHRCRYRSLSG